MTSISSGFRAVVRAPAPDREASPTHFFQPAMEGPKALRHVDVH